MLNSIVGCLVPWTLESKIINILTPKESGTPYCLPADAINSTFSGENSKHSLQRSTRSTHQCFQVPYFLESLKGNFEGRRFWTFSLQVIVIWGVASVGLVNSKINYSSQNALNCHMKGRGRKLVALATWSEEDSFSGRWNLPILLMRKVCVCVLCV